MKLLLHACCAPCSAECAKALRGEQIEPELFWFNPNIHPSSEYEKRKECLLVMTREDKLRLIIHDEYNMRKFISGAPLIERCAYCYRLRLEKTAKIASETGYDAFSTSLLISPYQNHELLKKTAEECAALFNIEFLYRDFRTHYREGQKNARERGFYMQKYCGCVFSQYEKGDREPRTREQNL